jgi:hypothetical protein
MGNALSVSDDELKAALKGSQDANKAFARASIELTTVRLNLKQLGEDYVKLLQEATNAEVERNQFERIIITLLKLFKETERGHGKCGVIYEGKLDCFQCRIDEVINKLPQELRDKAAKANG